MKDFSALIFEAADTFDMTINRLRSHSIGSLKGSTNKSLVLIEGVDWSIQPRIVDSITQEYNDKVGVLVHVAGRMYLLLIVDGQGVGPGYSTLWVLDGGKLGWNSQQAVLLFPPSWDRPLLYRKIRPGVVAAFRRGRNEKDWSPVTDAAGFIDDYLTLKDRSISGSVAKKTKAELVVDKLRADSVSDRYRTKGPRGV